MEENKNALKIESKMCNCNNTNNLIISQNNPKFAIQDFAKSGISSDIINDYINNGFLVGNLETWTLFYPDLKTNQKTSYKTTRFKNRIENKYIRTKGETSRIFKPLHLAPEVLTDTNEYIIITEGEKKAIKAVQEGFNCVALGGVWCWKSRTTKDNLIPDMHKINWKNKEVYLCFDNDICYKSQVLNALRALTYQLQEFGAVVKNIELPTEREAKNG